MSLTCTVQGFVEELDYSRKFIAPYLATLEDQKEALVGRAYREGYGRAQPDNHALELLSIFRPKVIRGNPRVRWQAWSDDPAVQRRAIARTLACNALSMRLQLRNVNEAAWTDWIFKWVAAVVTSEPMPGMRDTKDVDYWPSVRRISPKRFRYDPAALTMGQREWTAHLTIESRGNLMKRAHDGESGWNAEAIAAIKNVNVAQFRDENVKIPERDEIAYWTICCPFEESENKKPGYNGRVYTVVDQQLGTSEWIRKPYDWFGPPEGMHIMAGDIVVPDESAPMGPVTSTKHQEEYVNRVSRAIVKGAESGKNLLFIQNGMNLAEITTTGLHGQAYGVPSGTSLRDAIMPAKLGGIDPELFPAKQDARQSLDKASGITDIMRGIVDSRNKATQDALASQSAEGKSVFPVGKFAQNFVGEYFRRMGWFLDMDENVGVNIPAGVAKAHGLLDDEGRPVTRIEGGLEKGQDPDEIAQADLSVDIGSMASDLDSDAGFRVQAVTAYLQKVQAVIGPIGSLYIDGEMMAKQDADLTGIPEIAKLVDWNKMRALGLVMVTQGGEGQAPEAPQGGGSGAQVGYSKTKQAVDQPQLSKAPGLAAKASGRPSTNGKATPAKKPAMAKAGGS